MPKPRSEVQFKLTEAEFQELLASPKEFLSNPDNANKVIGPDLASKQALGDQIAKKMVADHKEVFMRVAGSGVEEYYAVTSVCRFLTSTEGKERTE